MTWIMNRSISNRRARDSRLRPTTLPSRGVLKRSASLSRRSTKPAVSLPDSERLKLGVDQWPGNWSIPGFQ